MKWTSIFVRPRSCQRWAGNSNAENGMNVTNELFQAQKIVKGVVTDESGVPLPGVAVKIKGQHVGTATDVSGHYQLTIDNRLDVVLEFSFMGMKTQEVKVGDRTEISVQLEALQTQLDEVMVVAYGTGSSIQDFSCTGVAGQCGRCTFFQYFGATGGLVCCSDTWYWFAE